MDVTGGLGDFVGCEFDSSVVSVDLSLAVNLLGGVDEFSLTLIFRITSCCWRIKFSLKSWSILAMSARGDLFLIWRAIVSNNFFPMGWSSRASSWAYTEELGSEALFTKTAWDNTTNPRIRIDFYIY